MAEKPRALKPIFLTILGYGALGSILIIADQIRRIYYKVNKATSSVVLSIYRYQPTYIYIEDPFVQEEIEAGFTLKKEQLKLTRFHKWLYNKIEESFIFRNWISYKKNLPWRLLRLAQDEHQAYRVRAVRSLAALHNLNDADYHQLAQSCDMRTAIGLARTTDNVKFLLDPPYFKQKPDVNSIINGFTDLFLALESVSKHPCLQDFVAKTIGGNSDSESKGFDDDFRFKFDHSDFIPICLDSLLHHSSTDNNARYIVDLGGLPLLMEVYKYLNDSEEEDIDSLVALSKLMSNLSTYEGASHSFFMSGWVKILAILSQHKDIRISAHAQRALSNFDEDDLTQGKGVKYWKRIYPLHPTKRTLSQPKVDVIFIHGLLGGVFITWRQRDTGLSSHKSPLELLGLTSTDERVASYQTSKPLDQDFFVDVTELTNWEKVADTYEFVLSDIPVDTNSKYSEPFYGSSKECRSVSEGFTKCWPKDWLAKDCPDIRILGVNYETNISRWTPLCPNAPKWGGLIQRSQSLMTSLSQAGVGQRPIVWVGHSMGGLLVKGLLSQAKESSDPALRALFDRTKAIVFYSTPHKGSHLADLNPTSQIIVWPSIEVQELRQNSPHLLQLHSEFLRLIKAKPIKVISFAERQSTYITSLKFEIRFVDSESADPDVGELYGVPLDHLCICKPSGRQSFIYQKVKRLIQEMISEVEKAKKTAKNDPPT